MPTKNSQAAKPALTAKRADTSVASACEPDHPYCPYFHHVVELLGRRWNGVIIRSLLNGEQRFNALKSAIPGLSDRLLTERLHELEQEHLVERQVINEIVRYRLTEKGMALGPILHEVEFYAKQWAGDRLPEHPGRIASS
jgi:DNA-binding HxlR family transcriptional regulator